MTGLPDVRPGQVWADNDPRSAGRSLRVIDVVGQLLPVAAALILAAVIVGLIAHTRDQGDHAEDRGGAGA